MKKETPTLRPSIGSVSDDPRLAPAAYNLAVPVGERSASEAVRYARLAAALGPTEQGYAQAVRYYEARARR